MRSARKTGMMKNEFWETNDWRWKDEQGKQTMRTLARNMIFLMKSIELGKKEFGLPEQEARVATHFIR